MYFEQNLVCVLPVFSLSIAYVSNFCRLLLFQLAFFKCVRCFHLLIQNASIGHAWVKLYPGRCEHKVYTVVEVIAPEFDNSAQVELTNHFVALYKCIHVSFKSMLCIHAFLVKFNFNEAVWVCTNNEVYFCPVNHDHFLNVIHDIR